MAEAEHNLDYSDCDLAPTAEASNWSADTKTRNGLGMVRYSFTLGGRAEQPLRPAQRVASANRVYAGKKTKIRQIVNNEAEAGSGRAGVTHGVIGPERE